MSYLVNRFMWNASKFKLYSLSKKNKKNREQFIAYMEICNLITMDGNLKSSNYPHTWAFLFGIMKIFIEINQFPCNNLITTFNTKD